MARSRGSDAVKFIETVCRITKDSVAGPSGELLALRGWQRALVDHLYAVREDGKFRHRTALIGLPRKNGKSALGSALAIESLLFGPAGGEVYSCAGDRKQAGIVFEDAKRMVGMDPDLSKHLKCFRDVIEFPSTGSIYRALSAEAYTKEGLNPSAVLFDEVHVQPNRELWDVMQLAQGARSEPMMVGITTAGVKFDSSGHESLCFQLYEYGKRVASGELDDPAFFMAWWEAAEGSDHRDPAVWQDSNPGYGDIVAAEDFDSAVLRTPEAEFRTKRCNQWVSSANSWLPVGEWDGRGQAGKHIPKRAQVVLAFDGSRTGDNTAITVERLKNPLIDVVALWERPPDTPEWKVPRAEVKDAIREACRKWDVVEIAWDEFLWLDAAEELEDEGLPVVMFPQTLTRMGPATQRFYEDVMAGELHHTADPRLSRHVANATLKTDARGSRLSKGPNTNLKIDLAVCAVMGHERAAWWRSNESEPSVWFL